MCVCVCVSVCLSVFVCPFVCYCLAGNGAAGLKSYVGGVSVRRSDVSTGSLRKPSLQTGHAGSKPHRTRSAMRPTNSALLASTRCPVSILWFVLFRKDSTCICLE